MNIETEKGYCDPLKIGISVDKISQKTDTKPKHLPLNGVDVKSPITEAMAMIKEMPNIRAEKIAQGRALLADKNFPSDEVLDKVAGALLGEAFDVDDE